MKNLIDFFVRHSAWVFFVIYMLLSGVMLFSSRNPYQQSVYLTSANSVSATVYGAMSAISGYFNLHSINASLEQRNMALEQEAIMLRSQVRDLMLRLPDSVVTQPALQSYRMVPATVISNSVWQNNNHILINRGSADGIEPQMGVMDHGGVVGVVEVVGPHSARVISLLNSELSISCKLRGSEFFGRLIWEGDDPRYAVLEHLPKHTTYSVGDTVVTSGYSDVFPEGVIVGTVEGKAHELSAGDVQLKVALTTNFSQLNAVRVIVNYDAAEHRRLEAAMDSTAASKAP